MNAFDALRAAKERPVLRAQAMPGEDVNFPAAVDAFLVASSPGINYASAKMGTQSYSAGTLTQR